MNVDIFVKEVNRITVFHLVPRALELLLVALAGLASYFFAATFVATGAFILLAGIFVGVDFVAIDLRPRPALGYETC